MELTKNPKVFEVIPNNFFNVLAGENKDVYLDCIFIIHDYLQGKTSFGCDRDELIPVLKEYFDTLETKVKEDTQDPGIRTRDPREKAFSVLRRLRECGWISLEITNNYKHYINFQGYAITIIDALRSLSKKDNSKVQGLVYSIYSYLHNLDTSTAMVALEQVYAGTDYLLTELKKLNSNIKEYIQKIYHDDVENDLEALLKMHFIDYNSNDIYGIYHRLKTTDNVCKFRPYIIDKLEEIKKNRMLLETICNDLIKLNKYTIYDEAEKYTLMSINRVIESFNSIDQVIDDIDEKHSKYVSSSIAKVQFNLTNNGDIPSKINTILKYMVASSKDKKKKSIDQVSDEEMMEGLFELYTQHMINNNSLYKPPRKSGEFLPKEINKPEEVNEETKSLKLERLTKKNIYSKQSIDTIVKTYLQEKDSIKASMIQVESIDDLKVIVYIVLYSRSSNVSYRIKRKDSKIITDHYSFKDFEIWGK
ncbi:Wadjet anti-phage system protein JetA family protein [Haloplasma contractile]|uniref:Uncharacterized protein n=1 Tax=Haloplasma contractile SSD-17B TaxID=1033810 RepID=F7PVG6_9MOLU|nr:Wadjet anti-phage system protein JetA family protein [Haloplasma contractile]ERJ12867.1 hypothetical protein HLPCO_001207 [Haloplasma contractile SSD-17B]